MKQFLAFINLILCFELIIAPLIPQVRLLSSNITYAEADGCPEGQTRSGSTGRCQVSTETSAIINQIQNCQEETDETARKNCFRNNANEADLPDGTPEATADGGWYGNANGLLSDGVNAIALAVPMLIVMNSSKNLYSTCASVSFYSLVAAGAALWLGNIIPGLIHANNLNSIEQRWKDHTSGGNTADQENTNNPTTDADTNKRSSMEAQILAFDLLAEAEDSFSSMSTQKAVAYGIAAAAYATSMVVSLMEIFRDAKDATCPSKKEAESAKAKAKAKADAQAAAEKAAAEKAGGQAGAQGGTNGGGTSSAEYRLQGGGTVRIEGTFNATVTPSSVGNGLTGDALRLDYRFHQSSWLDFPQLHLYFREKDNHFLPSPKYPSQRIVKTIQNQNDDHLSIFKMLSSQTEVGWDEEITNQKHIKNIRTASDFASFDILVKAKNFKYSSPSLHDFEKAQELDLVIDRKHSKDVLKIMKFVATNMMNNLNPLSLANAEEASILSDNQKNTNDYVKIFWSSIMIPLGGAGLGAFFSQWLSEQMMFPWTRAIVSLVLGVWSGILLKSHMDWATDAEKRAEAIRFVRDNFAEAGNIVNPCSAEDRFNPSNGKPECYCYNPDGTRNSGRVGSNICQTLFAVKFAKPFTDYRAKKLYNYGSCIDKNRQADPKCTCRKSSKGCLSVGFSEANMNYGSFKGLGNGLKPLNQYANGTFDAGKTSPAELQALAMRMRKAGQKLLKHPKLKKLAKSLEPSANQFAKKVMKASEGLKLSTPEASQRPLPTDPKSAIANLEKEIKEAKNKFKDMASGDGAGAGTATGAPKDEPELEFGMSEKDLEAQQGQLSQAMQQNLDYGQNDINTSTGNIFQVLSNRYMRSGMRRLFDDEGKAEADKPAETDINQ